MSTTTAERPQTALSTTQVEFPFEFFSEDRWTVSELLALLSEHYNEHDGHEGSPPSFDMILHTLAVHEIYSTELIWRAWYNGDVYHYGNDIQEELTKGFAEAMAKKEVETLEQYIWMYVEDAYEGWGGDIFNVDPEDKYGWGKYFMNDVEALLKMSGLFYIQVNYEDVDEDYNFREEPSLPNTWQLELHNCPIVEVW